MKWRAMAVIAAINLPRFPKRTLATLLLISVLTKSRSTKPARSATRKKRSRAKNSISRLYGFDHLGALRLGQLRPQRHDLLEIREPLSSRRRAPGGGFL